jgi:hypothetical protein
MDFALTEDLLQGQPCCFWRFHSLPIGLPVGVSFMLNREDILRVIKKIYFAKSSLFGPSPEFGKLDVFKKKISSSGEQSQSAN